MKQENTPKRSFKAEGILRQQLKRLENCAYRIDSSLDMKSLLVSIVAAVLVGCGESQQSSSTDEGKPVEPVARSSQPPKNSSKIKAPKVPIHKAAYEGNFEIVKQHLAAGTDVNKETDFIASSSRWWSYVYSITI